jgi:hypothetical protein
MADERPIDFQLHVASRDPIAGDLRRGEGDSEPFIGWIGLANVLARALERGDAPRLDDLPPSG